MKLAEPGLVKQYRERNIYFECYTQRFDPKAFMSF